MKNMLEYIFHQLMSHEEFKSCIPEAVCVYLKEREVKISDEAAILADEFVLTHKTCFGEQTRSKVCSISCNHQDKALCHHQVPEGLIRILYH